MDYTSSIKVKETEVKKVEHLLELSNVDMDELGYDKDAVIAIYTAKFSNGYKVDIKICSGEKNFFVDPVLFNQKGFKVSVITDADGFLGEYCFDAGEDKYTGVVTII